jgi:hypothetical protein
MRRSKSTSEFAYITISDVKCNYASEMSIEQVGVYQRAVYNTNLAYWD